MDETLWPPDHPHCPDCGYDTRGLSGCICPECGNDFVNRPPFEPWTCDSSLPWVVIGCACSFLSLFVQQGPRLTDGDVLVMATLIALGVGLNLHAVRDRTLKHRIGAWTGFSVSTIYFVYFLLGSIRFAMNV